MTPGQEGPNMAAKKVSGFVGERAKKNMRQGASMFTPGTKVEFEIVPRKPFPLTSFIKAVVAKYPDDKSRPSVTISYLADGQFYVAILRYKQGYGEGKLVVCNGKDFTLDRALAKVARQWLNKEDAVERFEREVSPFFTGSFGWLDD